MASIERYRGGRWRARYRTPDGRSRSHVFGRTLDAKRWLAEVEHSKLAGSYVDPKAGRITFRAYAEQWRTMQPHRGGTATSVEQQLRRHVYPATGDRSIGAILPSEIQALVTRIGQSLAASTVAVVYGRISAVFSAAVRDRLIAVSPCVDVKRPRPSSEVEVVLTTDQVLAIANAILPSYRALVLTMAGTGLRPGEAFGLTVDAAPTIFAVRSGWSASSCESGGRVWC